MTYHQTEYDDLLELVRKLPDKARCCCAKAVGMPSDRRL